MLWFLARADLMEKMGNEHFLGSNCFYSEYSGYNKCVFQAFLLQKWMNIENVSVQLLLKFLK